MKKTALPSWRAVFLVNLTYKACRKFRHPFSEGWFLGRKSYKDNREYFNKESLLYSRKENYSR